MRTVAYLLIALALAGAGLGLSLIPPAQARELDAPGAQTPDDSPIPECHSDSPQGCIGNNGRIAGTIYFDRNRNSLREPDEPGLAGVSITLYRVADPNTSLGVQVTGVDGQYQFVGLTTPDDYRLVFAFPPGYGSVGGRERIVTGDRFGFCCTVVANVAAILLLTPTATPTGGITATATPTFTGGEANRPPLLTGDVPKTLLVPLTYRPRAPPAGWTCQCRGDCRPDRMRG